MNQQTELIKTRWNDLYQKNKKTLSDEKMRLQLSLQSKRAANPETREKLLADLEKTEIDLANALDFASAFRICASCAHASFRLMERPENEISVLPYCEHFCEALKDFPSLCSALAREEPEAEN